jgi:hypothetical protein
MKLFIYALFDIDASNSFDVIFLLIALARNLEEQLCELRIFLL